MLRLIMCLVMFVAMAVCLPSQAYSLTPLEELGEFLAFDENLSTPAGQSCASCHHPSAGFADPDSYLPVSMGIMKHRFGNRNAPTWAYMSFSPDFYWDETEEMYIGGQFWDGRAANLVEQAKGPFLNILEMNNPNKRHVVTRVEHSDYADLFMEVFGEEAFDNVNMAYDYIAEAIAAYEASSDVNKFSSKYDYYLAGMVALSDQEMTGLQLFNDPLAGNCAACHPSTAGPYGDQPLFTDFSYDNLGVPKNWDNPFLYMPRGFNRDGANYIDYGLGGRLNDPAEFGKFKVPTLRNIAVTPPYMHNGLFATLTEVVDFYNTRDVGDWDAPEVAENVNTDELGNLGLTSEEVDAIVAFMMTLTDGYMLPGLAAGEPGESLVGVAGTYALHQNYPNPFNAQTNIQFDLAEATNVSLTIYNVSGQLVTTLVNGNLNAGTHVVNFDASALSSGVYFYRLNAGSFAADKKMVLMK